MSVFGIREATQSDLPGMAKVRVETWRSAYKGIVPEEFLANMSYRETAERWQKVFWEDRIPGVTAFVAEDERKDIVGIAICGPERDQDPVYHGAIYVLYVLPGHQNHGIGHGLVTACVQHLIQGLKLETMLIWVIDENPYRRFYESLGGKAVRQKVKEIGGRMITEVGYGWEEIYQLATPRTD